jgi:hypothetical protein
MAKKTKDQKAYDQNTELSTTADETKPIEPAAEAAIEALQDALMKVEFDEIEPAYQAICKELEKRRLPNLFKEAQLVLNWYQKHIYPRQNVAHTLQDLKHCSWGGKWKTWFKKPEGNSNIENCIKKFKLGDYGAKE